jgi:HEAT repeat protein
MIAMRTLVLALIACLAVHLVHSTGAAEPISTADDERTLRDAKLGSDDAALLAFFRKQTLKDADRDKVRMLIRQLGDDSFEVREKASAGLVALGNGARPFLEKASNDSDLEVSRRAQDCLRLIIENGTGTAVPSAAARLLAQRKPDGAAEVLLAYLASTTNDIVADEVRSALAAAALRDGKPDPVLTAALTDRLPERRAAAGEALCRAGAVALRPEFRKLLQDSVPAVRMRVALALAYAKDKEALPVLIELLTQLDESQTWQVEELLARVAGDRAPAVALGNDDASRRKCREAWTDWWRTHGAAVNLDGLDTPSRLLGYTMVVLLDEGMIQELGPDKKPRWQVRGFQFPLDAQYLPGERLLVAEHGGNLVTERNLKGDILWKKEIEGPLVAQRLPNGNTFIATRSQLLEVDRTGREIYNHSRPDDEWIMKALKLRNGEIACITMAGELLRLGAKGQKLSSFNVDVRTSGGRLDVLPNGHVLVPQMGGNKVVEYDADGKMVWEVTVAQPIAAVRLPNGNTLVTSMTENRAVEFDRTGKEVWEYRLNTRVTRAFRR